MQFNIIIFDELVPLNVVQGTTTIFLTMIFFFFWLHIFCYYHCDTRHNIFQLTYIVVCDVRKKLCGLQVSTYWTILFHDNRRTKNPFVACRSHITYFNLYKTCQNTNFQTWWEKRFSDYRNPFWSNFHVSRLLFIQYNMATAKISTQV